MTAGDDAFWDLYLWLYKVHFRLIFCLSEFGIGIGILLTMIPASTSLLQSPDSLKRQTIQTIATLNSFIESHLQHQNTANKVSSIYTYSCTLIGLARIYRKLQSLLL